MDAVNDKMTEIAAGEMTEKVFEELLKGADDPQAAEKAKEFVDAMDEEDKEEIKDIVGKYIDSETVSGVMDIMEDGVDADSVKQAGEYLKDSVSEEDIQKLREMYEKYKDQIE